MPRILLTRHGHVEGISPERFRGRSDLSLTEKGVAQAVALGARIRGEWRPVAIYAGPLSRCVATGEAIAAATGAPCKIIENLNDIDYGAWQSQTFEEVRERWPALFELWQVAPHLVRFPQGDSLQSLFARTAEALRLVMDHHDDETIVMVGHDSVNRAILLQLLNQSPSAYWKLAQDPCALNELEISRSHSRIIRINDAGHIKAL